jgi:hypothetical protein
MKSKYSLLSQQRYVITPDIEVYVGTLNSMVAKTVVGADMNYHV